MYELSLAALLLIFNNGCFGSEVDAQAVADSQRIDLLEARLGTLENKFAELAGEVTDAVDLASVEPISASIHCFGNLQGTSVDAGYNAVVMSSGDVFVSASIQDVGFQFSNTAFYSHHQNGVKDGGITIRADEDGVINGGWWNLSLDRDTLVTTVEYNDPIEPFQTWSMASSDCILNDYTNAHDQ